MSIIRNPELRGILVLGLVIAGLGFVLAVMSGKVDIFPRAKALDKIVFVSDRGGTNELYIMDTDGANPRRLTDAARVVSAPAISPAGDRIVFVGMGDLGSQVLTVSAGGGSPDALTASKSNKGRPDYSPDGKNLSFIASGRVYVAGLGGDSPDPVLPTHEELHSAMVARGDLPKYYDYAWGPNGRSMLGVTRSWQRQADSESGGALTSDEIGADDDIIVYLPELEGKAQKISFRDVLKGVSAADASVADRLSIGSRPVRVKGIAWASGTTTFVATAAAGDIGMLIVLDVAAQKLLPPIVVRGQELGKPALSPDGSVVIVPVKSLDKKNPSGLVRIDMGNGQTGRIAAGYFENPSFSPAGDRLMVVQVDPGSGKRDIASIDLSTGVLKRLTNDGGSFDPIWTPAARK